jgi:hypothetical protein
MDAIREQLRVALLERARSLFGEPRARAIKPSLEERAEHLARVVGAGLSEEDEPAVTFAPRRHAEDET